MLIYKILFLNNKIISYYNVVSPSEIQTEFIVNLHLEESVNQKLYTDWSSPWMSLVTLNKQLKN